MSASARTTTPPRIAENRRRAVAACAPGAQLVTVYQVHSPEVVIAHAPWPTSARMPMRWSPTGRARARHPHRRLRAVLLADRGPA